MVATPSQARPIVSIAAGDIVRDAHLPAYKKAEFPVAGIYDPDTTRARERAAEFDIPTVYATLSEASTQALPGYGSEYPWADKLRSAHLIQGILAATRIFDEGSAL